MENEPTTKTPIPPRSGFRNFVFCTLIFALANPLSVCLFVPLCLTGQDLRSTLVETPLQISLFSAKQTQFQNGQYKHKYGKNKGLRQQTTNNEQRTLLKTNPIKPNFKRSKPISDAEAVQWCERSHPTGLSDGERVRGFYSRAGSPRYIAIPPSMQRTWPVM